LATAGRTGRLTMAHERDREPMPVPDDDGDFPFEVRKGGEFFKGFATLDAAKGLCDRGNQQSGNFEVCRKGERVWPKPINT
jgi:hypothetical protein